MSVPPSIEIISPADALRRHRAGAVLVDVREPHERVTGYADGSLGIAQAALAADPQAALPDCDVEVLLICHLGGRSLKAAETLLAGGYTRVATVDGGTSRWIADGLPIVRAEGDDIDVDFFDRYSRHLRLPEVGEAGQRKLQAARVAMVGAGRLGSPAAFYVVAAGVGTLVLADDDIVERSNLQRQILHTQARIGMPKVESAALSLAALNPRVRVDGLQARVTAGNVDALMADVDVVIDGADNFPTRYLLSDACVRHGKPLVYGAVQRFAGQASVFDAGRRRGQSPCYRCLFPEPPGEGEAPNCAEAGVLGVLPGIIGLIQASEAIKLVLGLGESLSGRLLQFDALAMRFHETRLSPDPGCPVCAPATR